MFGTSVQIDPAATDHQFGSANEMEPTGITSTGPRRSWTAARCR